MSESIIWENDAHKNYDHEQDAWYLVFTPGPDHLPEEEWYVLQRFKTPEAAIAYAEAYTFAYPDAPVRVERLSFKPDEGSVTVSSLNIINPTPQTA